MTPHEFKPGDRVAIRNSGIRATVLDKSLAVNSGAFVPVYLDIQHVSRPGILQLRGYLPDDLELLNPLDRIVEELDR
jgi:hypothetical protein